MHKTMPPPPAEYGQAPSFSPSTKKVINDQVMASFWKRLVAYIVDMLIVVGIAFPLVLIYRRFETTPRWDQTLEVIVHLAVITVIAVIVQSLYSGLLLSRKGQRNGQSLGRQWMNIRVIRDSGKPVTFWFAVGREAILKRAMPMVLNAVYIGAVLGVVDGLWMLWDRERRTLHDMVMSTHVVQSLPEPTNARVTTTDRVTLEITS